MSDPKDEEKMPDFLGNLERKFKAKAAEIASPSLVPYYWEGEHPSIRISWLVDDLFPMRSVNLIVGESQAGKTFIALDLAVAIASGRPFFGKQVKKGGVLYIAPEGAITIPGRLKAARQGLSWDEKLVAVIQEPPPDLMDESAVDRIIATAKHINEQMLKGTGFPLAVIIIDTMMSGFTIGNWNEVGETSKAMKMLSRIQSLVGAAVIGIHHHGKDPSRGAAGSYALTAAADAILSVFKKGDEGAVNGRYISLTKSRFGETGRKFHFSLDTLPPDHREDEGDHQAFVVPLLDDKTDGEPKSKKSKPSVSKGDTEFQLAFETALNDEGAEGTRDEYGAIRAVRLPAVKDRFVESYRLKDSVDPVGTTRRAWARALDKLGGGPIHLGKWDDEEWLFIKTDVPETQGD
jgi:hypothetical protein